MSLSYGFAKAASSVSTWGLKSVLHRTAGSTPGKIALGIDKNAIADSIGKLSCGSILVVGTNGKTTSTLMLADIVEAAGKKIITSRSGANMASGIATALLQSEPAEWGIFETDELWLARVLPQTKSNYVLLLNLFPDQEDRMGVADIQKSIIAGLKASPLTTLIYNADDPHCTAIARAAGNPAIAMGLKENMNLLQTGDPVAVKCQECDGNLSYVYHQYDQLGVYSCPKCGFVRPAIDVATRDIVLGAEKISFVIEGPREVWEMSAPTSAAYMVYNVSAVCAVAQLLGVSREVCQRVIDTFRPKNGRLEELVIGGHKTLVNLAKNPAGTNQNIRLIVQAGRQAAVAFFINNKEGDGRDPSWVDAVDFESMPADTLVFVGGMCTKVLLARLERAGFAPVAVDGVDGVDGVFAGIDAAVAAGRLAADAPVFLIANYTALPSVRVDAERLAD